MVTSLNMVHPKVMYLNINYPNGRIMLDMFCVQISILKNTKILKKI